MQTGGIFESKVGGEDRKAGTVRVGVGETLGREGCGWGDRDVPLAGGDAAAGRSVLRCEGFELDCFDGRGGGEVRWGVAEGVGHGEGWGNWEEKDCLGGGSWAK